MNTILPGAALEAQSAPREGYVLSAIDGEHLIHFRDGGNIYIKASSNTGSGRLAMGTQQVMTKTGIPIHRHFSMDELFYILGGNGTVIINDVRHSIERGATVFIPANSWHGFENPDSELLLLWIVAPNGLDGFFRDTCNPPGVPPKQLTHEQIKEIAKKYGTEFR
jgi:quercetin dioxygenase-like cupin family protein